MPGYDGTEAAEGRQRPAAGGMPFPTEEKMQMLYTTKEEITALLGVTSENRTLEFKREVHLQKTKDKKEFLRDITALANTDGGHLIVGIKERKGGIADEIVPVNDPQALITVSLNLLQTSVEPQIYGLKVWMVEIGPEEYVIVFYVPMSWNRPHMVVLKGERGFWGRNDEGKYPLDVPTLRALFLWGQSLEDRLESFRSRRVTWLLERDTKNPYALLHFVPFNALQPGHNIPLDPRLAGIFHEVSGGGFQVNFEGGYIGELPSEEDDHVFYTQIFRSGAIEIGAKLRWDVDGETFLNLGRLDTMMSKEWIPALWRYKSTPEITPGITPPFVWALSLLNVQGLKPLRGKYPYPSLRPGDRPHMLFPLHVLEAWNDSHEVMSVMIPLFTQIWQAFGGAEDPYWTDDGSWKNLFDAHRDAGQAPNP